MHAKKRVALHPLLLFCMLSSDTHGSTMQNISMSVGEKGRKAAGVWSKYLEQKLSSVLPQNRICFSGVRLGGSWGGSTQVFLKLFCSLRHTQITYTHMYMQIHATVGVGEKQNRC